MLERVTGRVIHVEMSGDTDRDFVVTLGPPPDLYYFRASGRPPHLGQVVTVMGEVLAREEIGKDDAKGTLTHLKAESWEIDRTTYASRHVPLAWRNGVRRSMKRNLYDYQVEGAAWAASRLASGRGAILGDEPGTGKTAQTVAVIATLRKWPVVVCCPASLKQQWYREFKMAKHPPAVAIVEGKTGNLPRADVYIINYELLYRREAELTKLKPAYYVFDEAQELRNPKARGPHRAASATRLVRQRAEGALLLTGTPIENRVAELWRLLHLAEPKKWPRFDEYARRYLKPVRGKEIGRSVKTQAGRVERLNELHLELDKTMLRRLKTEVLKDLPKKSRRSVLVQLDDDVMRVYRAVEKDVVAWLKAIGRLEEADQAKRAQAIVKLTHLRKAAAKAKLRRAVPEYLGRWFDSPSREPLVIFGYHHEVMNGILRSCKQLGLRTTGITGSMASDVRQKAVDAFQAGRADVFLAPIMAAGVGLNLQRAANALFVERIWTPSGLIQAEDRVWRLGSTKPVTITYLDAVGTIDEHIAATVESKQRLIRTVVDDDHASAEAFMAAKEIADVLQGKSR